MRNPLLITLVLTSSLGLGACFEGPERVDARDMQPTARTAAPANTGNQRLPDGHPPLDGRPAGTMQGGELPAGHPPIPGQLPPGHPPMPGAQANPHGAPHGAGGAVLGGEPIFGGIIELGGELADSTQGGVFVIVRAPGQANTLMVRKLEVTSSVVREDGSRVLAFELTGEDHGGGALPANVELEAYFDPDGIVESKEGQVRRTITAARGDLELRITLDPATADSDHSGKDY